MSEWVFYLLANDNGNKLCIEISICCAQVISAWLNRSLRGGKNKFMNQFICGSLPSPVYSEFLCDIFYIFHWSLFSFRLAWLDWNSSRLLNIPYMAFFIRWRRKCWNWQLWAGESEWNYWLNFQLSFKFHIDGNPLYNYPEISICLCLTLIFPL